MRPNAKSLLLAAAALPIFALAQTAIQVNYYYDQGCSDYITSLDITDDFLDTCVDYYIEGAGSFNIAGCAPSDGDQAFCGVTFYTGPGCSGNNAIAAINSDGSQGVWSGNAYGNCATTAQTIDEPITVRNFYA